MLNRFVLLCGFLFLSALVFASADAKNPLQQGDEFYAKGDVKTALNFYEQAVQKNPDSAQIWFKLARTQMVSNQYLASVKSYQKSITLDHNNALAFIGMAITYLHLGQYNHARASLQEAARIDPSKQAEVDKVLLQLDNRLKSMESSTSKATYSAH